MAERASGDGLAAIGKGHPLPLGSQVVPGGVNFSVFSRSAAAVRLCLFEPGGGEPSDEIPLDPRVNRTGDIWHLEVPGAGAGTLYAWRVDGPWAPESGQRFDPGLLLLDPYARAVVGAEAWGTEVLVPSAGRPGVYGTLLRSMVVADGFDWKGDRPLNRPLEESVIYELHVRGFTRHPSAQVAAPGTFEGLVAKIPYLQSLGITAVELMPVAEFPEEANLRRDPATGAKLRDYWGYNPLAFFAPKASYAAGARSGSQVDSFRRLVRELHLAGIEVILDVVFNHTAEGNGSGPTFSFRGLENGCYYILGPEGSYHNYSGCGNTFKCNHPLVRDLILDCLRYWVIEMHVDGFRFDLASILGRGQRGEVLADPPLLERIAEDPILARTKIIAEAWDAAGLYQVGSFPAFGRWAEWNGRFRDDVRRFVKGDPGLASALATRLAGSADLYQSGGRAPYHSVNFVVSHDGFTLWDLVSYQVKRNEANGELNLDGDNHNLSWNHGVEGPTADPAILALRRRQAKNCMALLMVSQGVPMVLAGDECLRTQGGNNNAYCQDNETSWFDWGLVRENAEMVRFFKELVAFRRRHPALRRKRFFAGVDHDGDQMPDISWHGLELGAPDWSEKSRFLAFLLDGSEAGGAEPDDDIYVAMNSLDEPLSFALPYFKEGVCWRRVVDTSKRPPRDVMLEDRALRLRGQRLKLEGRSVGILVARPLTGR